MEARPDLTPASTQQIPLFHSTSLCTSPCPLVPMLTVHWPLYTICPISAAGFYAGYFFVWDALLHRFGPTQYASLGSIAQRCFCANCNSLLHTYAVVLLLLWVIATDETLRTSGRLSPHYNGVGYSAMCVTLGYFSLSVPWSMHFFFVQREREVVPLAMLLHHCMVVTAALVYVLTTIASFYGAVAFACMELSNWFFIPRTMAEMLQWRLDGLVGTVNGACLVLTFIFCRIGVCTAVAALFTFDLSRFDGSAAEWTVAVLAYLLFVAVLALSYVWLRLQVLPGLAVALYELRQQRRAARSQQRIASSRPAVEQTSKGTCMDVEGSNRMPPVVLPAQVQVPPTSTVTSACAKASKAASASTRASATRPPGRTIRVHPHDEAMSPHSQAQAWPQF